MIFLNDSKNQTKRKKKKTSKLNLDKGITLIALVITIIVLLILAGVTIAALSGQNGILSNTTKSKEANEKGNELDLVKLATSASVIDSQGQAITLADLQNNLNKQNSNATARQDGEGFIVKFNDSGREYQVDKYGKIEETAGGSGGGSGETGSLPSTAETTPFLPDGFTQKEGTSLDNGLTITDGTNSYVWVEVPKSIYTTATSETDYTNIEADMKTYTTDYKSTTWKDIFYSNATTGLTKTEYNNLKQEMLTSIFKNGGFWISQYEIGTETLRTSSSASLTSPKSQEGLYPYNYVTCSQAQGLAEQMNPNSSQYKSSLLFGVQWDLTCKFLETKAINLGATVETRKNVIKNNSTTWGNYYNATFDMTKGKYSTNYGSSYTAVSGTYLKLQNSNVIYTTGATNKNSAMNIYDLAGNQFEWTLEYAQRNH
jgi:type II secretory pathway pseudopilin PulG